MSGKTSIALATALGRTVAPARFVVFAVMLVGGHFGYRALVPSAGWTDALAMAFDGAALVFIVGLWPLLRSSDPQAMRRHAEENDANRGLVLILTTFLTLVVMAAITGEMKGAQRGDPAAIAKLVGTLLLIWLFANLVYTLHYAHVWYSHDPETGGDSRGLDFPKEDTPDYTDFAYFALTLGMTFQTSDVDVTNRHVRRIALLHSFAAFVFNIGVIAFTINVLGGASE